MIIIVAPYSPVGLSSHPHLGAARKIEMVIESLAEIDPDIVLVNSAHNSLNSPLSVEFIQVGKIKVNHIIAPCYSNQKFGKLFNLFDIKKIISKCFALGEPNLLWIYNGYAFENLFSKLLINKIKVPVVLEFEDWHFSRSRGLNPKPYIDNFLYNSNLKNISFSFGVNDNLVKKTESNGIPSLVLPGIVPERLIQLCDQRACFDGDIVRVGYFGGLSVEKGVDKIIEVINKLPNGFKLVLSGAGKLESSLVELASAHEDKIEFHGRVSEDTLYNLIASVDVILNPHSPISDMSGGVFPFKVIEGIASGRLLISTELPSAKVNGLLDGVLFYDGTSAELLDKIINSNVFYSKNIKRVHTSKEIARDQFSKASLLKPILNLIK